MTFSNLHVGLSASLDVNHQFAVSPRQVFCMKKALAEANAQQNQGLVDPGFISPSPANV
jgi:hypothetical protein